VADARRGGLPLLLIHGAGGSRLIWNAPIRRLPNAVAFDLPGHGSSPGPGRDRIADYAADVLALMDTLAIERAVLLGYSMGGAIALECGLLAPERAAGLVVLSGSANIPALPLMTGALLDEGARIVQLMVDHFTTPTDSEAVRRAAFDGVASVPLPVLLGDLAACEAFDREAEVRAARTTGALAMPVLVIHGTADRMIPFSHAEMLAEHLPAARLVALEGVGHLPMSAAPDAVADAVRAWLPSPDGAAAVQPFPSPLSESETR
jgi:pimeloyl-ACP methyl ester carboxylesterase